MKTVLIVGGGPGGLTTLKTLLHFPGQEREFDPLILEAAPSIGGTFSQRSYENGALVSSKQLTSFSDYRFPLDSHDHVTMDEYVAYLERYVVRFGLDSKAGNGWRGTPLEGQSRLQLNARVVGVEKLAKGRHRVRFYKKREEFKDRKVMILGIGETSMDLSFEAIQAGAKEVVVCHRGGFLSFPKVLNDFKVFGVTFDGDLPIDGLITNQSTKAMPYINRPYQPSSRVLSDFLKTSYIDPPLTTVPSRAQSIDLALWPSEVLPTGQVKFTPSASLPQSGGIRRKEEERMGDAGGRVFTPDMVVFATGYRTDWSWVGPEYRPGAEARVRDICDASDVSAGWIGFVRPGVAEQQAQLWALLLLERVPIPTSRPHYKLLASKGARIQHGVDYSAYMATLASDMGAAPSLRQLWSEYGFKVLVGYCFGAAFVPYYRLVGPYRAPEMEEIVTGELWETITRRGLLGNLFMGLIPMVFYGFLNGFALLLETLYLACVAPVIRIARPGGDMAVSMPKKMD
ncbi:hypothetical protein RQP46_011409 [Phenoliferia psychrophenolica]